MKKLKENKQYIIVGLIIFIILIIGFFASDNQDLSVSKKTTTKTTSTTKTTTTKRIEDIDENEEEILLTAEEYIWKKCEDLNQCVEFDEQKAEKILFKYILSNGNLMTNINEDIKNEVVVETIKGKIGVCQDYFPELYNHEEDIYCGENDKVEIIEYDTLLKKKKELFGEDSKLDKNTFSYGNCGHFKYIENIDSFVFSGYQGCGTSYSLNHGVIVSFENVNELYIVAYDAVAAEGDLITGVIKIGYTFKIQDGNYYLIDVTELKG